MTLPDGSNAVLYSSANPNTVERHVRWMEAYGIDGVFFQRFTSTLSNPALAANRDLVLMNLLKSAARHGRKVAVAWDVSGQIYVAMFNEVDEGTAIFKAAETQAAVPAQGHFLSLDADGEDVPSDWYLRVTGEIGRSCAARFRCQACSTIRTSRCYQPRHVARTIPSTSPIPQPVRQ